MFQEATLRFSQHARLDSWKSVAGYLGCSPRTAQRWFSEYRLPVRRVGSGPGKIFAYADELDGWLRNRSSAFRSVTLAPESLNRFELELSRGGVAGFCDLVAGLPQAEARLERSCEFQAMAERMWNSLSASDLNTLTRLYRQAIDIDPDDARALAGVSVSLIAGNLFSNIPTFSNSDSARFALQRAMEIGLGLPEVQTARAWTRLVLERDLCGARCDFDAVLEQRPVCAPAVVGRALSHIADARLAEAAQLLQDYAAQFPLSAPAMIVRCWVEYLAGDSAAARHLLAQGRRAGLSGSLLDALEALAAIDLSDPEKSIEALHARAARWSVHCPHHCVLQGALGYSYAVAGRISEAHNLLHSLTRSAAAQESEVAYAIALIALGLNDQGSALHWLNESHGERSFWSLGFEVDPILAPLRTRLHGQLPGKGLERHESGRAGLRLACVS